MRATYRLLIRRRGAPPRPSVRPESTALDPLLPPPIKSPPASRADRPRRDGGGGGDAAVPPLAPRAAGAAARAPGGPVGGRPGPAGLPGGPVRRPRGVLHGGAGGDGPGVDAVGAVGEPRGARRGVLARRVAPHHAGPPALHRVRPPLRGAAPRPPPRRQLGQPRRPQPVAAGADRRPPAPDRRRGGRAVAGDGAGAGGPRRGRRRRRDRRRRDSGPGAGRARPRRRAPAAHREARGGDPRAGAGGRAARRRRRHGDRLPGVRAQVQLGPQRLALPPRGPAYRPSFFLQYCWFYWAEKAIKS